MSPWIVYCCVSWLIKVYKQKCARNIHTRIHIRSPALCSQAKIRWYAPSLAAWLWRYQNKERLTPPRAASNDAYVRICANSQPKDKDIMACRAAFPVAPKGLSDVRLAGQARILTLWPSRSCSWRRLNAPYMSLMDICVWMQECKLVFTHVWSGKVGSLGASNT